MTAMKFSEIFQKGERNDPGLNINLIVCCLVNLLVDWTSIIRLKIYVIVVRF
ncbi:hypothetical protein bcgnr5396_57600 [Bacillus cereus]